MTKLKTKIKAVSKMFALTIEVSVIPRRLCCYLLFVHFYTYRYLTFVYFVFFILVFFTCNFLLSAYWFRSREIRATLKFLFLYFLFVCFLPTTHTTFTHIECQVFDTQEYHPFQQRQLFGYTWVQCV